MVAEVLLGHVQSKPSKQWRKNVENGREKPGICGGVMPVSLDKKLNYIHYFHTLNKERKTRLMCRGC